jgi:phosphoribosylformylglycinamidine cyclo-ligase
MPDVAKNGLSYKDSGVDIDAADRFVGRLQSMMRKTHDSRVLHREGAFAPLFALTHPRRLFRKSYRNPILVSSTDGVGTKLKLAFMTGIHNTVGIDLVAMSVNDLIVTGAEPLFFLDYIATGKLTEDTMIQVAEGIVEGCKQAQCALIGGETAEMPDFYKKGEYDLAGFAVGVVDKHKVIDGRKVKPGDSIIGIGSNGVHSNGFSLVRKICFGNEKLSVRKVIPEFEQSLGEELLTPTRLYVGAVRAVLDAYSTRNPIKAMAHITGGGLIENLPRVLPKGCGARIHKGSWEIPRVFPFLKKRGNVQENEMYRVFNMGVGYVMVVDPYFEDAVVRRIEEQGDTATVIGRIVKGKRAVTIKKEKS